MKKLFLILGIIIFSLSACKTSKHATSSAYEPAIDNTVKEVVEEPLKEEVVAPEPEPEKPVVVKTEEVTVDKSNDNKLYPFYVIIGSFSIAQNAYDLQDAQVAKDIPAVVLKSETGMLRVACLGTDSEQTARAKIAEIRKGTEFPDVWLLKSK